MANLFQGLLRGTAGALGELKEGGVIMQKNLDVAQGKRLDRLSTEGIAQSRIDALAEEGRLGRELTIEQNRLNRELTESEGKKSRASQELRIDLQAQGRLKSQGGSMLELQEKIAKLNATIRIADMNLAQKFTVTNQDDAQQFAKEQKKLDRSLQESLQSDRIQAQTSLQELQGSQTIAQITEAQKNYVTNAEQSLLHSKELETYVLNAREAFNILKEKRIVAQNVLDDARDYQYTSKEAQLKHEYDIKGLEKRVTLAKAAEKRANTEWVKRVGITQTAELAKLDRIAELEDTAKTKWSKMETAAAQDAQQKANALAFAKSIYDNAAASIKQLEKIRAELDPEDAGFKARQKQLTTYIEKYHAEVVKPAETRYQRWSGIEVLYPGSYELNTSDQSPAQVAINLDEDRTVAIMEGVYNLRDRDSRQFRNLPEKILTAISQARLHTVDLSGDEAALRMSFIPKGKLKGEAAENAYLKEAYPKIFEDADGKYTDENLNSMVVSALKRIAAEGAEFRKVQPRAEEKGGPQTAISTMPAPGEPLPAADTTGSGPPGSFTPTEAPDLSPEAMREKDENLNISRMTMEELDAAIEKIRIMKAHIFTGKIMPGREENPDLQERQRADLYEQKLLKRKLELQQGSTETGMINGAEDRGLLAQAGDAVADFGAGALDVLAGVTVGGPAQADDKPLMLPSNVVTDEGDSSDYMMSVMIDERDAAARRAVDTGIGTVPGEGAVGGEPYEVYKGPWTADQIKKSPLYELNNPTGIKLTSDNWDGEVPSDNKEFTGFSNPIYAYRASARIISKYGDGTSINAKGVNVTDVTGIITLWLGGKIKKDGVEQPQEKEGNVEDYVAKITEISGGDLTGESQIQTVEDLKGLLFAMTAYEMGGYAPYGEETMSFISSGIEDSGNWNETAPSPINEGASLPRLGGEIPRIPTGQESQFIGRINNYPQFGLIGQY